MKRIKKLKVTKTVTERSKVRIAPEPVTRKIVVKSKPTKLSKALKTLMKPGFGEVKPKSLKKRVAEKAEALSKKDAARQRYRDKANVDMTSCEDNLAQLPAMAKMHTVTFPNGKVREIPGFTVTAMGEPLGITGVTVTRWVKRSMIPAPILKTSRGTVYGMEEARTIVRIVGEHQKGMKQYREEHTDLKEQLFSEIERIRAGIYQTK